MTRRPLAQARATVVGMARIVVGVALLAAVELGLRTVGFARLTQMFGIRLGTDTDTPGVVDLELPAWAGGRVRAAQRVVQRWPFGGPCLRESLLVALLLRRFDPAVCIGVNRCAGDVLGAHAWVEIAGAAYDPDVGRFHQLGVSG
jgi:Transglutaminase-like superfamily